MKQLLYFLIMLTVLVGCSKDDTLSLSVSNNELVYSVDGGEQIVYINTDDKWDSYCQEDWVLVRQQHNRIRVIVDANTLGTERVAKIQITNGNNIKEETVVTQEGVKLTVEKNTLEVRNTNEVFIIPIKCNTNWNIENDNEWIEIQKEEADFKMKVLQNYQMQNRTGKITIKAGDLSETISIYQAASPWYESIEMVTIEPGSFYMGAQKNSSEDQNFDENAYMIESPIHNVTLDKYNIGKFEVTQAQWKAAMGNNPSTIQGDNLPVENVTWEQVQEFIKLLNDKTGKNYRLPTEAEWEFAAKGGNKSEGFKYSGFSVLGACGWYYSNSEASIHEVGSKYPNELGIYDMSGNVREWCNDWFDYYPTDKVNNPQGPNYGNMKINRGGSWSTPAINCRNSYRHTDFPNEASHDLGFRLALSE